MFSFLRFFNSKPDADEHKTSNGGTTLNLNSTPETLNVLNSGSPVASKPSRTSSSFRCSNKDNVMSPGFSFRIAQRAREVRSTTPSADVSNLSNSYTLENSLNSTNMINGNNKSRDVINDKKRKLMETLDNFGVRKRTRQESGIDAILYPRRKPLSKSYGERITHKNAYGYKLVQPISMGINSTTINSENKKTERHGDFESSISTCHSQKKPRTRNNEILSSYSSSKFLLKPGQKRSYQPTDYEDESPARKHCKSCTCCGSTILLENDQNPLNKSDKTTETDISDDLITVAASRIFNRSGKTQVVKKMSMKTILDELLDDDNPTPYTSIEKVEAKKKKAQNAVVRVDQCTTDTPTKLNRAQPAESGVLSAGPSAARAPISAAGAPLAVGEGDESPDVSAASPTKPGDERRRRHDDAAAAEVDGKEPTSESAADGGSASLTVRLPRTEPNRPRTAAVPSPARENDAEDRPRTGGANDDDDGKPSPPRFAAPAAEPAVPEPSDGTKSPGFQFGGLLQNSGKNAAVGPSPKPPIFAFGAPPQPSAGSSPSPTAFAQFGAPKSADDRPQPSTAAPEPQQFGATPGVDDATKSTTPAPVLQFGGPKFTDAKSTATAAPVLLQQFGAAPEVDDAAKSGTRAPLLQFGAPKVDDAKSIAAPVMRFGASQAADGQPTTTTSTTTGQAPALLFGTSKGNSTSVAAPSFSFGNNHAKTDETANSAAVKFQFGAPKPDGPTPAPPTDAKNTAVFGSTGLQNQNLFSFGKTADPPKYNDAAADKSTVPKFQFGSAPAFGTPNADQTKPVDGPAPKLVFGGQTADGKPVATSTAAGMLFANNAALNPTVFQFNSAGSDPANNKKGGSAASPGSFAFPSAAKPAPAFGSTSPPQGFGAAKPPFQFGAPKSAADQSKTPFSAPVFGSSPAVVAPFKFGGNDKTAASSSFGNAFAAAPAPSSNQQTLQLTTANSAEKPSPAEPFKFGSAAAQSGGAFQFGAGKPENGPPKFGQAPAAFPGFGGFGNSASQQTAAFGSVTPSPQTSSSPFGNAALRAAPAFGAVASSPPPSNAFGTNPSFQFGGSTGSAAAPGAGSSAFAFGGASAQAAKPDSAFNFSAPPKAAASPFQFGSSMATPQFGTTQPQGSIGFGSPPMNTNGLQGSSQPLFSIGTAPAVERRKAKAVRRRQ